MPEMKFRDYKLSGPAIVKIYSQAEMAEALGLSETRLIGALKMGIGLCYHAAPEATGAGYEFNERAYQENIKVWNCYRDGGHCYQRDSKYEYLPNGASTCAHCGDTRFH
jgi:hypothetical protein